MIGKIPEITRSMYKRLAYVHRCDASTCLREEALYPQFLRITAGTVKPCHCKSTSCVSFSCKLALMFSPIHPGESRQPHVSIAYTYLHGEALRLYCYEVTGCIDTARLMGLPLFHLVGIHVVSLWVESLEPHGRCGLVQRIVLSAIRVRAPVSRNVLHTSGMVRRTLIFACVREYFSPFFAMMPST